MDGWASALTIHYRQNLPLLAQDGVSARSAFIRAKKLVKGYSGHLRKIASHIGDIARGFEADPIGNAGKLERMLRRYADAITPWAQSVAEKMVAEVAQHDRQAWRKVSAEIGRSLQREIETAPTGQLMQQLQAEQVTLIRSLPLEAAERVQKLATENMSQGRRASEIAAEIMRSGEVSSSRARLIAETETSRAGTLLTAARAQHIGSEFFIWRTAKDNAVRHDHRILEGKPYRWADPPVADQRTGAKALPGCIYGCRCYPEIVLPTAQ